MRWKPLQRQDSRKRGEKMEKVTEDEKKVEKVLFLCDGEVPACRRSNCYKRVNGSFACRHTSDVAHAIHFRLNRTRKIYIEETQPETAAQATTE